MYVRKFLTSAVLCGLMGVFSVGNIASAVTVDDNNAALGSEAIVASPNQYPEVEGKRIVINIASRGLYLYNQGVKTRLYPIAVGKASTPTPVGYYRIVDKEYNPTWTDPSTGKSIESGPACPLGYRWMGIYGNYGIHGTNRDSSIGSYASNGCIRMHEEDVEELFELVAMETPVDITYNRVVVEKAADDTVVYYIYPDGYGWQPLTNNDVNTWLKGFGVDAFVSDEDIAEKIQSADGNPTFIAKAYPIYVNKKKISGKAVVRDGITYLPAISIAESSGIALNTNNGILVSKYGKAVAQNFKNQLFINSDDVYTLFGMQGGFADGVYSLNGKIVSEKPQEITAPVPVTNVETESVNTSVATGNVVNDVAENNAVEPEAKTEAVKEEPVKAEVKTENEVSKPDFIGNNTVQKPRNERHSFQQR